MPHGRPCPPRARSRRNPLTNSAEWQILGLVKLETLLAPVADGGEGWTATQLAAKVSRLTPRGSRKTNSATIGRLLPRGLSGETRRQRRVASLTLALAIERATDGLVTAEEIPLSRASKRLLREIRAARPRPELCEGAGEARAAS